MPEVIDWPTEIRSRDLTGAAARVDDATLGGLALDAIAFISDTVPGVARRLASGRLTQRSYRRIVADMALRVVRNPSGLTSESDGTYSYGASSTVASGDLWIPDKDLAILRGSSVPTIGAFGLPADRGWGR